MIFKISITLSAFLLLLIQPMIAKALLPVLGGSAQVWNICLFFFQFILFLGYGYAFLLQNKYKAKGFLIGHLVILAIGFVLLIINREAGVPLFKMPQLWLLGFLTCSIGMAYFALSAHSPLIQALAHNTKTTTNPYRLYLFSNIGSLAGLLCYPFIIEPLFNLDVQWKIWITGYVILYGLMIWLISYCLRNRQKEKKVKKSTVKIKYQQYLEWIALAFLPTAGMIATNTHLATDIAPIPLLWVATLAIYLISLIIAFSSKYKKFMKPAEKGVTNLIPAALIVYLLNPVFISIYVIYFFALFAICLLAHLKLVNQKPDPAKLTNFYLCLSFGGMLGGFFGNFIAPLAVSTKIEFIGLLLVSYIYLLKNRPVKKLKKALIISLAAVAVIIITTLVYQSNLEAIKQLFPKNIENVWLELILNPNKIFFAVMLMLFLIPLHLLKNNKYIFVGCLLLLVIAINISTKGKQNIIFSDRNFYGSLKIIADDKKRHILTNGTTIHGFQLRDEPNKVTSYYLEAPQDIKNYLAQKKASLKVAVIGLGTGTQACALRGTDMLDYYEINPMVIDVARNDKLFSFLKICPPTINIIEGDGRMMIAQAPDKKYDLIIIDAFSSDAIPMHLITVEAVQLYRQKLKKDGVILFHISNRYLDLFPVIRGISEENGLQVLERSRNQKKKETADWVAVFQDKQAIETVARIKGWKYNEGGQTIIWTDKYTNIFSVLK